MYWCLQGVYVDNLGCLGGLISTESTLKRQHIHPSARGEMSGWFLPTCFWTHITIYFQGLFLLNGSAKKHDTISPPPTRTTRYRWTANGVFLKNYRMNQEKKYFSLKSRRSPCRTTKPILSLSLYPTISFSCYPLWLTALCCVRKYWMIIINKTKSSYCICIQLEVGRHYYIIYISPLL